MSDTVKTCIICPAGCTLSIRQENGEWIVSGNRCPRGKQYAIQEMTDPRRTVTATAATDNKEFPRIPLKSSKPVPKMQIGKILEAIGKLQVRLPIQAGSCLLCNAADTKIDLIATRTLPPETTEQDH